MSYNDLKTYGGPECPDCGSQFTNQIWKKAPLSDKAKDPYDLLDKGAPGKKIFSGPKVSSKTTV